MIYAMAAEPVMHGRAPLEVYVRGGLRAVPDLHIEMLESWVTLGGAGVKMRDDPSCEASAARAD